MILYRDGNFNFIEIFNQETGTLFRSGIIEDGVDSHQAPHMRAFPELIDVGIMGSCHAASSGMCREFGVDCYQNAHVHSAKNLSIERYKLILEQCRRKAFQIVLGGAGDPIKHEKFHEILKLTRREGIVPNLTTSGFELTDFEAEIISHYCGAVAVSYYSRLDSSLNETNRISAMAIEKLTKSGCIVNIHFVLSKDTVYDAILRLTHDLFPKNINGVVFLLYKSIGEGKKENAINATNENYLKLFHIIQDKKFDYRIGFDTCQAPAIIKHCDSIDINSIELCESGRFSMYVDHNFKAFPCSFARYDPMFDLDLNRMSILDAWTSDAFSEFRTKQANLCTHCHVKNCFGCALDDGVNICGNIQEVTQI